MSLPFKDIKLKQLSWIAFQDPGQHKLHVLHNPCSSIFWRSLLNPKSDHSVPGFCVRQISTSEFLSSIPALREGRSLIAPLWQFYGVLEMAGRLQYTKKKHERQERKTKKHTQEDRKLTETECKGTPWGHHIHHFRKHMGWSATSDTHLKPVGSKKQCSWGHPKYIKTMSAPYLMNPNTPLFLCFLANYQFTTQLAFQAPRLKCFQSGWYQRDSLPCGWKKQSRCKTAAYASIDSNVLWQ